MTHRYWTLGLLAVLAGGFTAGPAAATQQDTFNRLIAKVAPTFPIGPNVTPKVACACPNDGSIPESAGFVVNTGGDIVCGIPTFDSSGSVLQINACHDFAVLGH
jgi:hypothetical protein